MISQSENEPNPTGAEALLKSLKFHGVDYLFANAGTDFPPIIAALGKLSPTDMPVPVTIPHETASVGMAHGYYLVTGQPQSVMVHVNVGLANAVMGVINAASDNVPVLVMSGRTPITEMGRKGARMTPIQYGQEMFDQSSLVSDTVKYHYEMRYPEQAESLVSRALVAAKSDPAGPVYLSLPREPLTDSFDPAKIPQPSLRAVSKPPAPNADDIAEVANLLRSAEKPMILVQRGDPAGRLSAALSSLCKDHAIAVAEPFSVRNVMPTAHPMFVGYDPKAALADADVVIVLDCDIPWIEAVHRPDEAVKLIHVGADPHFLRMPIRGYKTDIAMQCDPTSFVDHLARELASTTINDARAAKINAAHNRFCDAATQIAPSEPMSAAWLSRCLSSAMDQDAVVFSELGVLPSAMNLAGPNRVFSNPHSGGLGWALSAALGAQLADRDRLTIACIGDGSYIFANPVACHQIAEALELPLLVIIKNNGMWNAVRRSVVNAYPNSAAAKANTMPLTSLEPAPDYLKVAEASRAYTERVTKAEDLPAALTRAIAIIKTERRQVVLDVRVEISDTF